MKQLMRHWIHSDGGGAYVTISPGCLGNTIDLTVHNGEQQTTLVHAIDQDELYKLIRVLQDAGLLMCEEED